jgi:hypothetical protein
MPEIRPHLFPTGCVDSPPYAIPFPCETPTLEPHANLSTGRSTSLVHPPFPILHPTEGTGGIPSSGQQPGRIGRLHSAEPRDECLNC